jgi:hypothetical protein
MFAQLHHGAWAKGLRVLVLSAGLLVSAGLVDAKAQYRSRVTRRPATAARSRAVEADLANRIDWGGLKEYFKVLGTRVVEAESENESGQKTKIVAVVFDVEALKDVKHVDFSARLYDKGGKEMDLSAAIRVKPAGEHGWKTGEKSGGGIILPPDTSGIGKIKVVREFWGQPHRRR